MKTKTISYALAVIVILLFSSAALAAIPVTVTVGKGTIITLKEPSKRLSIPNTEVADVNLISPTEIQINGKKVGSTNLIVWDKKGKPTFFDINVTVACGDTKALESYVKEIAPESDITAECEGDMLVLRGTTKNRYTCKRDKEPVITRRDEKSMVDVIETQDTDTCVETFTKIEQVAKFFSPKVLNLVKVSEAEQIVLEIRVAQINKTKLQELGVSVLAKGSSAEGTFPGLVASPGGVLGSQLVTSTVVSGGTTTVGGGTTQSAGIGPGLTGFDMSLLTPQIGVAHFASGIAAFLRALTEKGYGKILAEPNLTVRSGEKGEFHVGQEIPIQTVTGVGTAATVGIEYKEVGIILNFGPQVLETGAIRLKVMPAAVKSVSGFLTFSGIVAPQIDSRTVTTSVDLKDGESLVLAGLLSEDMKKNLQKIPILGDIPILGALFRSTRDELINTELAFFITPRLVKPIPPGVKTELPGDRPMTPEEEREFEWIPLPKKSTDTNGAPENK